MSIIVNQPRMVISTSSGLTPKVAASAFLASAMLMGALPLPADFAGGSANLAYGRPWAFNSPSEFRSNGGIPPAFTGFSVWTPPLDPDQPGNALVDCNKRCELLLRDDAMPWSIGPF
jgi:hypothetical protein